MIGNGNKANAKSVNALIATSGLAQVSQNILGCLPPLTNAMLRKSDVEKHLVSGSLSKLKSHAAFIGVQSNKLSQG